MYASVIWCTQETCADDAAPVLMRCYFWGGCDATGCTAGHMPQVCSVTARRASEGSLPLCNIYGGNVYASVIWCTQENCADDATPMMMRCYFWERLRCDRMHGGPHAAGVFSDSTPCE